jgi:putative ABC transport system permease protein
VLQVSIAVGGPDGAAAAGDAAHRPDRSWRAATPPDAPDRFVINVLPEQAQEFRAALASAGVARYDWFPMIRGRLVAVNGRAVRLEDFASDRARRLVDREFNLSHAAELPSHNQVTSGRWTADEADGLSVEEGLAETLGLKLGDRLRFDIAGSPAEGRITSLRKVDWTSMRVNFFVLFPRVQMPEHPATFVAAFRAPSRALDASLARGFPNITSVDVSQQIAQVQRVLDQVVRSGGVPLCLCAGGWAAGAVCLGECQPGRPGPGAGGLRAFGAGRQLLRQVQRAELLTVGALAGLLASAAAVAVGGALAASVFEFSWAPSPWVPLGGTLAGAVLAWAAGWWSLRGVLRRPVMETLRRAPE